MMDGSHDQDLHSDLSQSSYPHMGFEGDAGVGSIDGARSFYETTETTSAGPNQHQTYPIGGAIDGGWSLATNLNDHLLNSCLGSAPLSQPISATPASATGEYGSISSNPTGVRQHHLVFDSPTFDHLSQDRGLITASEYAQWTRSSPDVSSFASAASQSNDTIFDRFGQIPDYNTLWGGAEIQGSGLHQQLTKFSVVDGEINFTDSLTNTDNNFGLSHAFPKSDYLHSIGDPKLDPSFRYVTSDAVGSTAEWATTNSFIGTSITDSHLQLSHLPTVMGTGPLDIQQNLLPEFGNNPEDYFRDDGSMAYDPANVTSFPSVQIQNTASLTHGSRLAASESSSDNAPPAGTCDRALTPTRCSYPSCAKQFRRISDRVRHERSVHLNCQGAHLCPVAGCGKSRGGGYSRADKVTEHLWKKHADLGFTKA